MILPLDKEALAVAETAACLWEAMITSGPRVADNTGQAELRTATVQLAPYCEKAWEIAQCVGYDAPFDWEFCPMFLNQCVDWTTRTVKPDWPEIAIKIGRDE